MGQFGHVCGNRLSNMPRGHFDTGEKVCRTWHVSISTCVRASIVQYYNCLFWHVSNRIFVQWDTCHWNVCTFWKLVQPHRCHKPFCWVWHVSQTISYRPTNVNGNFLLCEMWYCNLLQCDKCHKNVYAVWLVPHETLKVDTCHRKGCTEWKVSQELFHQLRRFRNKIIYTVTRVMKLFGRYGICHVKLKFCTVPQVSILDTCQRKVGIVWHVSHDVLYRLTPVKRNFVHFHMCKNECWYRLARSTTNIVQNDMCTFELVLQ